MMLIQLCGISDTHGMHKQITVPKCDILVHCGDFSMQGKPHELVSFLDWFKQQSAKHHVYIAGNHDLTYETHPDLKQEMLDEYPQIHYLEDSGVTLLGVNIWGSPYTPEFNNWAFNLPRGGDELYKKWEAIPRNTDVLLTHGPAKGILDRCNSTYAHYPQEAGCELLRHRIEELGSNLKYHFSGHVHEGQGMNHWTLHPTTCINCSITNASYAPTNKPVLVKVFK